jgi:hypothetical protein
MLNARHVPDEKMKPQITSETQASALSRIYSEEFNCILTAY